MEAEVQLVLPGAEQVDPGCPLHYDFLEDEVAGAAAFDLADAELGQASNAGEEAHEAHEDAHFVGDLLVDVKLDLRHSKLT